MSKTEAPEVASASDPPARLAEVRQLLDQGRAAEAAPLAAELAQAHPDAAWAWAILACSLQALCQHGAELEACERELSVDPTRVRARWRAATIRLERDEPEAALVHFNVLSDAQPEHTKLAIRVARLNADLGRPDAEAAAWTRVLQSDPGRAEAHDRLADLYRKAGRVADAVPHMRKVVEASPGKAKHWYRLALGLEAVGEGRGAEAAWRKVQELRPGSMEAGERMGRLQARLARGAPAAMRLKVIGNCQAYGVASCLRALNPDLDVEAVGLAELRTDEHVAETARSLGDFDAVALQPLKGPPFERLGYRELHSRQIRFAYFPALHFTGFHPDALRIAHPQRPDALVGDWHSVLMLAGFRMGLTAELTAELFNAYVYGALGYFDEYAKAIAYLEWQCEQIGWPQSGDFVGWGAQGPFVHVPNHPCVAVLMRLARRICEALGVETDAAAVPPDDLFEQYGDWPLYPEIGKRLGLHGELIFASPGEGRRALDLEEAIAWSYRAYAGAPPEALAHPRVDHAIQVLRTEGV